MGSQIPQNRGPSNKSDPGPAPNPQLLKMGRRSPPLRARRQTSKADRKALRCRQGFGERRTDWHRHSLSVYTWMGTNRGPQKSWLHQIGKAQDPGCQCGSPLQDGDHLTFSCPRFATDRANLLGTRKSWEELDKPNWRKDEGDDSHWDTIEAWFDFLYQNLR